MEIQFSFNGLLVTGTLIEIDSRWVDVVLTSADGTDEEDGNPGDLVSYDLRCCFGLLTLG